MNPQEYIGIKVWGRYMGSLAYYVQGEQREAAKAGAPRDAIYRDFQGRWVTVSSLHEGHAVHPLYREAMGR